MEYAGDNPLEAGGLLRNQQETDAMEDPIISVEWDQEESPFVSVATVSMRPRDSWSDEQVQKIDEQMRFSVWTGLAAHRPLGNINRARRTPFEHSAKFREGFNRCRYMNR